MSPTSRHVPSQPHPLACVILALAAATSACGGADLVGPEDEDASAVEWTSVAVGFGALFGYACGVTGGEPCCWGETPSGPSRTPVPAPPSAPVARVIAGWTHACVLTSDGKALCWGRNGFLPRDEVSPPAVVLPDRSFRALAAGNHTTCGVETTGDLVCWKALKPEVTLTVRGLAIAELTSNSSHACAVTTDGAAYCWGGNREGQLGDGTWESRSEPAPVAGGLRFRTLAPGSYHTCGLTLEGAAYCWGWNVMFTFLNPLPPANAPVPVAGGHRFTSIASGFQFSCGLTQDGQAWCWGDNDQGELGHPDAGPRSSTPVPVDGGIRFRSLAAGGNTACGISTAGDAYCWGSDTEGQLGIGSAPDGDASKQFKGTPTRVPDPRR
ncbi:MAG: hypothetical protein AMXMBFR53_02760 [Gemmatimonadota bacterium]